MKGEAGSTGCRQGSMLCQQPVDLAEGGAGERWVFRQRLDRELQVNRCSPEDYIGHCGQQQRMVQILCFPTRAIMVPRRKKSQHRMFSVSQRKRKQDGLPVCVNPDPARSFTIWTSLRCGCWGEKIYSLPDVMVRSWDASIWEGYRRRTESSRLAWAQSESQTSFSGKGKSCL